MTSLLQFAEFGLFLFEAAGEAGFLELEVAQLLFVLQVRFELDHAGAKFGGLVFEAVDELAAAAGVDGHLETGDAGKTPLRVG
ncbi:MAG: hypothetical protein M3Y24_09190 [Acidobacteriota bacterium]|nr:hypothetical protein [Acidobacteriota bacterium]